MCRSGCAHALLVDRVKLAPLSLTHAGLSSFHGGLRADHQPALGHAIMAQVKAVILRRVVDGLPGVPPQGLADDLRPSLRVPGIRVIKPRWRS